VLSRQLQLPGCCFQPRGPKPDTSVYAALPMPASRTLHPSLHTIVASSSLCCALPLPRPFSTGTQSELQALATNPSTRFSSLFDEAQPGQDGKCPEGFSPANPPSGYWKKKVNGKTLYVQCLKIKVKLKLGGVCCGTVCVPSRGGQRGAS
jgi:hypothetical protein